MKASGLGVEILYDYFKAFVNAGQKSVLMSLIGIAAFAGTVYILAFAGLFSKQTQMVRFFIIWLAITALPAIFITWKYMMNTIELIKQKNKTVQSDLWKKSVWVIDCGHIVHRRSS